MAETLLPFVGPTYRLVGANSMASRRAVNMFLQSGEGEAKYEALMIGTPGTQSLEDLTALVGANKGCRGLHTPAASVFAGEAVFWVYGSKFGVTYKDAVTGLYDSKVYADVGDSTERVSMADNGFELLVATGTGLYALNLFTEAFQDLTAGLPFLYPKRLVFLRGRMYCICGDDATITNQNLQTVAKQNLIWASDIADATSWPALNYTGADLSSDPVTAIIERQGELVAFGPRTVQVFAPTEDPDAPIAYIPGSGSTYVGTNAPDSVATIGGEVFWLGSNAAGANVVFTLSGYSPKRVSDHGIESLMGSLVGLTYAATAFAYQQSGHSHYCLTIPQGNYTFEGAEVYSDGVTVCYDSATGMWHERMSREPLKGTQQAWQPLFAVYQWDRVVVGNGLWPVLMDLREDVFTDYDPTSGSKPLQRIFEGPVLYENMNTLVIDEFVWDILVGTGSLGSTNYAMLQTSNDGGFTWSSIRRLQVPATGQYAGRVSWIRLGSGRAIRLRITVTADARFMAGAARIRTRMGRP